MWSQNQNAFQEREKKFAHHTQPVQHIVSSLWTLATHTTKSINWHSANHTHTQTVWYITAPKTQEKKATKNDWIAIQSHQIPFTVLPWKIFARASVFHLFFVGFCFLVVFLLHNLYNHIGPAICKRL